MAIKEKPKIGIAGIGYVGGAVETWFKSQGYPVFLYDKYKKIGSPEELNKAEIIFLCLPTPFIEENEKGFDDSALQEVLNQIHGEKIIVIKSTVLPGTTESYQKKFPQHKILFNPEFLREKYALKDFLSSDRQVLGITEKSKGIAKDIIKLLPSAPWVAIIPAREAEMIKYMANSFLATKVVLANEFYELCQKLKIDYEKVKEGVGRDKRIGKSHLEIFSDNYQGYGGSCFPKDINALLDFANSKKINMPLLKKIRAINRQLLKKSGLSENYFLNNLHRKK